MCSVFWDEACVFGYSVILMVKHELICFSLCVCRLLCVLLLCYTDSQISVDLLSSLCV